jgi:hypothetical protein
VWGECLEIGLIGAHIVTGKILVGQGRKTPEKEMKTLCDKSKAGAVDEETVQCRLAAALACDFRRLCLVGCVMAEKGF